ncbi:MAG: SLBB domain-containing protein, partial [Actinomycetota bacterium]
PLDTVAPSRIAVHVVGAVERPGVYHLGAGARADDVLRAAGGPTSNADLRRVNLAAAVHDGEQLYIPRVGERLPADVTPSTTPSITPSNVSGGKPSRSRDSQPSSTVPLIIDVNRATADDLDRLPGIGPSTAKAMFVPDDNFATQLDALLPLVKTDEEARRQFLQILETMGPGDPRTGTYR